MLLKDAKDQVRGELNLGTSYDTVMGLYVEQCTLYMSKELLHLPKRYAIDFVANQQAYPLPGDLLQIKSLSKAEKPVIIQPREALIEALPSGLEDNWYAYIWISTGGPGSPELFMVPTPDTSEVGALTLDYYASAKKLSIPPLDEDTVSTGGWTYDELFLELFREKCARYIIKDWKLADAIGARAQAELERVRSKAHKVEQPYPVVWSQWP